MTPWLVRVPAWMLGRGRPPGPFRTGFWRSPLRTPWLTSVLGLVLLAGLPVVAVTGLLSYAAYEPRLPGNDLTPDRGLLGFYLFGWPTRPVWLYRVTQGTHVVLGLTLVPVLLAKLWSVIPKLFAWPPVASAAHALERVSVLLLVGGGVFEFLTGILNIQRLYVFPFSFYPAHLYGAWIFLAALVTHVALKWPRVVTALRTRGPRQEPPTDLHPGPPTGLHPGPPAEPHPGPPAELHTGPQAEPRPGSPGNPHPGSPEGLVRAGSAARPAVSRRGLLAFTGGASLTVFGLSVGQTLDGPLRGTALLIPHGRSHGPGPDDFQVNTTAASAGIDSSLTGPSWRLTLTGTREVRLSREELLALPQRTYRLPIACVEGWSTEQEWTGVRLADLARLCGAPDGAGVYVASLQEGGAFSHASLSATQAADPRSLLALRVNAADLSPDHGFPARIIVPGAPGVHNTKWVRRLEFRRFT